MPPRVPPPGDSFDPRPWLAAAALLALLWAWALFVPAHLDPALHQFRSAELSRGALPRDAGFEQTLVAAEVARPAPDAVWQPVQLPDLRARHARLSDYAEASSEMRWYRLRYEPASAGAARPVSPPSAASAPRQPLALYGARQPLALYVPRVVSGPVTVLIRETPQLALAGTAEGSWRVLYQSHERWLEEWNRPLLIELPADAGQAVEVVLGCAAVAERGIHMLSTVWIGPLDGLHWRAYARGLLQLQAPMATSVAILIVGLFALGVWLRRRAQQGYLYFALAAAVWCLRNLHYYVDIPGDDAAFSWFWWATNASLSWAMLLVYRFALRFDSRRHRGLEWTLTALALASSMVNLPLLPWTAGTLLMQHIANSLAGLGVAVYLTVLCWRGAGPEVRAITLGCWVGLAFGVNDLLLLGGRIDPETIYLMPYAPLVVLGSFVYATLRRYVQAMQQVEGANEALESRLREREAELQTNHERLRKAEREQALLRERERLMADMHDGIGSTLMSARMMLERGDLDSEGAAGVLRECVDDLRLVIDSLEPVEQDLALLLASQRQRLGRRLQAGGVSLDWAVQDVPRLPWLSPPDALQVLRLVQEVLTNVLKHAEAQRVQLQLRLADANTVELLIADDGRGFEPGPQAAGGRGLGNLRLRARQLKAQLEVKSAPGQGTQVRLLLPVQRT